MHKVLNIEMLKQCFINKVQCYTVKHFDNEKYVSSFNLFKKFLRLYYEAKTKYLIRFNRLKTNKKVHYNKRIN